MRLLLDSHVFLWWQANDTRLTREIKNVVRLAKEVYVSAVTAWELGLKVSLGKLRLPASVEDGVTESGFWELPFTFAHARVAVALPHHHRDPFDRMLIAQALVEHLTLVTHDLEIQRYEVAVLSVR